LWDLVDVYVNLLEGGELTHSLNLFLFRVLTLGLLVVISNVYG
jgi:hypothetical protein